MMLLDILAVIGTVFVLAGVGYGLVEIMCRLITGEWL